VLPASRVPLVVSTSDDRLKSIQQDTTELWPADQHGGGFHLHRANGRLGVIS
jgi:hypothetical protein